MAASFVYGWLLLDFFSYVIFNVQSNLMLEKVGAFVVLNKAWDQVELPHPGPDQVPMTLFCQLRAADVFIKLL